MNVSKQDREMLHLMVRQISEELCADGVIIAVTRRRRRATQTFAVHDGNVHTVRGMAEFVYGHFCEDPEDEEEIAPESESEE